MGVLVGPPAKECGLVVRGLMNGYEMSCNSFGNHSLRPSRNYFVKAIRLFQPPLSVLRSILEAIFPGMTIPVGMPATTGWPGSNAIILILTRYSCPGLEMV